jgi:hypothetical protein
VFGFGGSGGLALSLRRSPSIVVAIGVGVGLMFYFGGQHQGRVTGSFYLVLLLGSYLAVIPHEFGHALMARVVGCRRVEILFRIPFVRRPYRLALPGMPIDVGPSRAGTSGRTRFSPTPAPAAFGLVLLAGPLSGAAALGLPALAVTDYWIRAALITALALHLVINLFPNSSKGFASDGTQLLALARPQTRRVLGAIRRAEHAVPQADEVPQTTADGNFHDPVRRIAVLDAALADPWLDAKSRDILRTGRASNLWLTGRFLEAAREYEQLKDCRFAWADAFVTAALFRQLPLPDLQLTAASSEIETRRSKDRSLATAHTVAVLRLVQGRPAEAWAALSGKPGIHRLGATHRAVVLATQALCAPDATIRERLWNEANDVDPSSIWLTLADDPDFPAEPTTKSDLATTE